MELGVQINLYEETDIPSAFWYASEAGFKRGQVTSHIHGITAEQVRQMAVAARNQGFHVDAVGCYINPLRLDSADLSGVDAADWQVLAENMGMMNGVERLICWSGTLGKTLNGPNLLNGEEETFSSLYVILSGLRERVRGLPLQLFLEPFAFHVLDSADACVRMTRRFPGSEVKVVLDVPNMITTRGFAAQKDLLANFIAQMAPAVGLVHLKDCDLGPDGQRRFTAPGAGALDYGAYLRAIAQYLPEVPVIITEVTTIEEMRLAREFVESLVREYGL